VTAPSFSKLLIVELWLSFLYAGYNGAMVVYLTEIVPVAVRTAGFSLAYSLATTIGGSTPAIVTFLIHATGNRAMPGAWLSVAAAVAFVGILIRGDQVRGGGGVPSVQTKHLPSQSPLSNIRR
jgi:hypothetical protein